MKKAEMVLIWVTAALICILLGFFLGRNAALSVILPGSPDSATRATDPTTVTTAGRININTATVEQLMELPGIGEQIARNIVTYRQIYGPFEHVEDLLNVELIGQTRLNSLLDYISVVD